MRTNRTLVQRFADWLRYSVAERIDRDGSPKSAGASFTFVQGVGRVWHDDGHGGPGCPVWYLSEEDYRKAHTDGDEPRPLQVGDEVTLYPIIGGYDAVRAMFDPHNPPPGPLDAGMTTAEALEGATRMGEAIRDATLVITFDNASGTFTPTGPRYEFGEARAATLQAAIDASGSLADIEKRLREDGH